MDAPASIAQDGAQSMPPSPMTAAAPVTDRPHLPFRPDIEGMRAIAVMLVVAAHAGVPWLQGGYIGVDVFFVISGYLITGLLVKEQEATGRIALLSFYARRLLRLMPALVVVVVATCLAALVLLAPFEHGRQALGAIGAITWTSNIQFALENVGYFDAGSQDNLFLHTWSLGVEEQFYLLWPLLLVYGVWATRRTPERRRSRLVADIAGVGVLSLAICLYLTAVEPKLAFYTVFSRGWQFALGAIAYLSLDNSSLARKFGGRTRTVAIAVACALVAIATCAVLFTHGAPFPGWRALIPSIATAAVLAGGAIIPTNPVSKALSARPMCALGGLSYAWYLWHWPVFLLGHAILPAPTWQFVAMLALLSLALAWLTHRFVERKARGWRPALRRPALAIFAAVVVSCIGIAGAVSWGRSAAIWSTEPAQLAAEQFKADASPIYRQVCDQWYDGDDLLICPFGAEDARHTLVLLGDSTAAQWLTAVRAKFADPDWRILVMTKSACPLVEVPFFYERIGRRYVECESWREKALKEIERLRPAVVAFGSSSGYPYSISEWRDGSTPIVKRLVAASPEVVMIAPLPTPGFDAPKCAARDAWRQRFAFGATCTSGESVIGGNEIRAALAESTAAAGARTVDYSELVCPGGWCTAVRRGTVVFRDRRHLTETYVELITPEFAEGWDPRDPGLSGHRNGALH